MMHTMQHTMRHTTLLAIAALGLAIAGCEGGSKVSDSDIDNLAGQVGGLFGADAGKGTAAGLRMGRSASSAMEEFGPEREYEVGRAVAAQIVHRYPLYEDAGANRYVNLVGRLLAEHSDRPEVFAGYNFQVLDTDVVNAYAAPGAYIFVTRGMLRLCANEHELAAALAHEIAHVEQQHALKSIKQSRWTGFAAVAAKEAAGTYAGNDAAAAEALAPVFTDMVGDVSKTLLVSGYSRDLERSADQRGAIIMQRVGYDPAAMAAMLAKLDAATKAGGPDFASTHPNPGERVALVNKQIGGPRTVAVGEPLRQRFESSLAAARAK